MAQAAAPQDGVYERKMTEKRLHTKKATQAADLAPEYVLAEVVSGLLVPGRHRAALRTLLTRGPYRIPLALLLDLDAGAYSVMALVVLCAELARFLSAVVQRRSGITFDSRHLLRFEVHASQPGDVVTVEIGTAVPEEVTKKAIERIKRSVFPEMRHPHDLRDLAFVQLVALLMAAGLRRLRLCEAPRLHRVLGESTFKPCGRLWVRVGKAKSCSRRCQRRVAVQQHRQREWEAAEAKAARRAHRGRRSR